MFGAKNSAVEIFGAIVSCGEPSRAEISKITGYSLMTVGKAVDALEKGGLVVQTKRSSGAVGRNMSVCTVNPKCGMLLYDLSKSKARICICDMSLNNKCEFQSELDDFSALMAEGFGYFLEYAGGELLGMACIAPEGLEAEYAEKMRKTMGNPPELVTSPRFACAAAKVSAICSGPTVFVRITETYSDMVLWDGGFIGGAHGRAADISFIKDKNSFAEKLADYCMIADPQTVHFVAEAGEDFAEKLGRALASRGVPDEAMPRLITSYEDIDSTVFDGAAVMLRQTLIEQNMAKNT